MGRAPTFRVLTRAAAAMSLLIVPGPDIPRSARAVTHTELPVAEPNDNRHPAGVMHGDTLVAHLEVRLARWYPEAPGGSFAEAPFLGESGHAPQVPGPLIRVRLGTIIEARLTNALTDSIVTFHGLHATSLDVGHPSMVRMPSDDSIVVKPGETRTVRFTANRAGTFFYFALAGKVDWNVREREQLAGALVVDAVGARTDDRIFVMNIWSEPVDSILSRNALAINGLSWPYTERIAATVGDTVRWRVVNTTARSHPMHLHGFYFRVVARADTVFSRHAQRTVVTQLMDPFTTMSMEWVPTRPGNWLFHCHLGFHVASDSRLDPVAGHADHMSGDVMRHMAGLVMGIEVRPGKRALRERRSGARALRLYVQEGAKRGRAARALGFVLQRGAVPARDSVVIPGSPLILTRGQPTDITVINRLDEATNVHWHGIELESYSDGVGGWSGAMNRLAPSIAPGDSFVAHLTLPRAGTFIYHTHLNDVIQLTSGLYGALIVLEPGAHFDPALDHVFVAGWDGAEDPPHLLVNGDSTPPPLILAMGRHHRMRFVTIGVVGGETFRLVHGTELQRWRAMAKDGAEFAKALQLERDATVAGWAGETYDFDFVAKEPGEYALVAGDPKKPMWTQRVVVR